jgi:hypothetical protein
VPDLRRALARAFAAFRSCNGGTGYDVVETTDWASLYAPWLINNVAPQAPGFEWKNRETWRTG